MTTLSASVQQLPDFGRHAGRIGPANFTGVIHCIGCGATGSHLMNLLARHGAHKFDLWDADIVEPHNLANQCYDVEHIGMPKVEALKQVILRFNPQAVVTTHNEFFTEESSIDDIGPVVLTTDSMHSRETIMKACQLNINVDHVFETRVSFEGWESRIVDNFDIQAIDNFLHSIVPDDSVPEGPCNLRICPSNVMLCAAFTAHQICEMYVSRSEEGKEWASPRHQVVEMSPRLSAFAIA